MMPMKGLVLSVVWLLPSICPAQTQPAAAGKKPLANANKAAAKLRVGDTCYVTVPNLPLRARPVLTHPAAVLLPRNAKVVVVEVHSNHWVVVDHYDLDVGVEGYVQQQYLSRSKAK
jgi:hypothetical protein